MNLDALTPEELSYFSASEKAELSRLISLTPYQDVDLQQLWRLMDIVWEEMECDNFRLNWERIEKFYRHPIWLLNGLFTENHDLSLSHRWLIVDWIFEQPQLVKILDYGGGTGLLARMLAQSDNTLDIEVYEPFPSQYALKKAVSYSNVQFVDTPSRCYDCLICTDVLEHIADPLLLFAEMINFVNQGGYLIIANHFYPAIKCHLPCTFHLRHTFDDFAQVMGLSKIKDWQNGYINVYKKDHVLDFDWEKIRRLENKSKRLFWLNELRYRWVGKVRKAIKDPQMAIARLKQKVDALIFK